MKKALSLLLLLCLSLSIISACATSDITIDDENEALDFRGGKIVISEGAWIDHYPLTKGVSSSADREIKRYAETEKEFNCKFDYDLDIIPATAFLSALLSGNGIQSDLLYCQNKHLYESYLINTLIPTENILSDPISDKWKVPSRNGCGYYGGKYYGFFPNYWEITPNLTGFVMINLTVLEKYSIDDPHEIIEAGEWDWEHFREFLAKTVISDGDTQWKGMLVHAFGPGAECIMPFLLANGARYVTETDGRWTCQINSPEAIEALGYVRSLAAEGLFHTAASGSSDKYMVSSGNGLSSDSEDTVCGVRYPYGPRGNKDIVSVINTHERIWGFPIFSAYTEDEIGTVAEYLFEPLDELYPNGWKDIIEDKYFFYTEDFEYYIKSAAQSEYIDNSILEDSFWILDEALISATNGMQSPEIALENAAEMIQEEVNEKYNR